MNLHFRHVVRKSGHVDRYGCERVSTGVRTSLERRSFLVFRRVHNRHLTKRACLNNPDGYPVGTSSTVSGSRKVVEKSDSCGELDQQRSGLPMILTPQPKTTRPPSPAPRSNFGISADGSNRDGSPRSVVPQEGIPKRRPDDARSEEHAHEGQKVRSAPRIPNIHRPADQTRGTAPSAAWRLTQMLVRVSSHSCPV